MPGEAAGTYGVPGLESEVVVLDVEVEVWKDELQITLFGICAHIRRGNPESGTNLLTDLLPDDSGHFISVEFDHWVCHGDFRLWESQHTRGGQDGRT